MDPLHKASQADPLPEESSGLRRYDYYQGPQALGNVWTLQRGAVILRCALATHSLGWELRLVAGKNFIRTQVCKSEQDVTRVSDAWSAEARTKGFGELV